MSFKKVHIFGLHDVVPFFSDAREIFAVTRVPFSLGNIPENFGIRKFVLGVAEDHDGWRYGDCLPLILRMVL